MAQNIGIPTNLLVYKPQQQTTALCWQINPETPVAALDLLDFEVEIDVVADFSSINKKTYTKDSVINYQDGILFKAFVIADPFALEQQKYYWRVRVNSDDYISEWSDYSQKSISSFLDDLEYNKPTKIRCVGEETDIFIQKTIKDNVAMFDTIPASSTQVDGLDERYTKEDFISFLDTQYEIEENLNAYIGPYEFEINQATWYEDTETAENLLPDNYVYTKIGNTNIKRIIEMYMRLIGAYKNEIIQVANNYNYKKIQDTDLYDMLGVLLSFTRDIEQPFITYKYELLSLWNAYLHQGTEEAINIIISAFYGVVPTIEMLIDVADKWTVYTDQANQDVTRFYVRNITTTNSLLEPNVVPNPYVYTNQYLVHNLLISVDNIYNIQLDKKIILEILNNLKPLNVNIILSVN